VNAINEEQNIIERDGHLYTEDGEYIGKADKRDWIPETVADAEFLLALDFEDQMEIRALEARIKLYTENTQTIINRHKRSVESRRYKFGPALEGIAKANLAAGTKKFECPYGTISFRIQPESLKVEDKDKALEWARNYYSAGVVTKEEFQISKVTEGVKADLIRNPEFAASHGFVYAPPREVCTIRTGAEK
jgi:hypothetical protein